MKKKTVDLGKDEKGRTKLKTLLFAGSVIVVYLHAKGDNIYQLYIGLFAAQ